MRSGCKGKKEREPQNSEGSMRLLKERRMGEERGKYSLKRKREGEKKQLGSASSSYFCFVGITVHLSLTRLNKNNPGVQLFLGLEESHSDGQ